ncbi:MAG: hypothetical protein KKG47_14085 [Proteobacteria bacterium]|nr:hypothetical protein [Pseudomonadota bacterium]MBU1737869.1 hypothetical protein [Pseudomonadota bacterium]
MNRKLNWLDRIMTAVTFAEANCPDEARNTLTSTVTPTHTSNNSKTEEAREMRIAHAGANN